LKHYHNNGLPVLISQVVNIESGTELGANEDGEVCVRGPTVMKGKMQKAAVTSSFEQAL